MAGRVAVAVISLALAACSRRPEPLPVLGHVPAFSLSGSDGRTHTHDELKGRIWIADFIFTQCPGVCPLLSAQMAQLQSELSEADLEQVRLVSFSVDPTRDTPEAMRVYAQGLRAKPERWWFLTGDRDRLYTLIGKGFLLAVADRTPGADQEAGSDQELITHSDRFVLVDAELQIRGYYRPLEEGARAQLLTDIRRLSSSSSR